MHLLQIWPPGGIAYKLQILHWLQVWPPDGDSVTVPEA